MLQDPRHRACVGCAHFPHNLACNSPTLLSNIEIGTLIFRGFQGVRQEVLWGIACEMWGGSSAGPTASSGARGHRRGTLALCARPQTHCAKFAEKRPFRANGSALWRDFRWEPCSPARGCRHHLTNRIDDTSPVSTQRLPTPPRRHDAGPTDRDAHAAAADTTLTTGGSHPDRL